MKICMNANIMKTQFFHKILYDLKFHFYVMKKFCDIFTLRSFDLITIDLRYYGQLLILFNLILNIFLYVSLYIES